MHCVDLGESFPTRIFLQTLASIQLRTSPVKFVCSPRTDPRGWHDPTLRNQGNYGVCWAYASAEAIIAARSRVEGAKRLSHARVVGALLMLEGKESTTKWTGDDPAAVLGKASPLFGLRSREFTAKSQGFVSCGRGTDLVGTTIELCLGQPRKFKDDFCAGKDTTSLPGKECT